LSYQQPLKLRRERHIPNVAPDGACGLVTIGVLQLCRAAGAGRRWESSGERAAVQTLREFHARPMVANVNCTIKSSYLLSFLESVPEVASRLHEPHTQEKKSEDVVKEAEQAVVLVLVY
jgi:hypothetical protein